MSFAFQRQIANANLETEYRIAYGDGGNLIEGSFEVLVTVFTTVFGTELTGITTDIINNKQNSLPLPTATLNDIIIMERNQSI